MNIWKNQAEGFEGLGIQARELEFVLLVGLGLGHPKP